MKKIIKMFLILLLFTPTIAFGSVTDKTYSNGFLLNGKIYSNFLDAYNAAKDGDTITLFENVKLETTLLIDKDITINLNENDIEGKDSILKVQGGKLKLIGKGVISETNPNMYAVLLKGTTKKDDTSYSYLYVGKDVTLEGWAPVFIDKLGKIINEDGTTTTYSSAYGVLADIYGTLNGKTDVYGGSGIGIYVNGTVNDKDNYPIINIHDGANISGSGVGLYVAGYSNFNIDNATITGVESGIGIKSGKLSLKNTTVIGTGDAESPSSSTNGINPTGAAIQIESNKSYAGGMSINIQGGVLESKNNSAIVEYLATNTPDTLVSEFSIKDTKLISASGKEKLSVSQNFLDKFSNQINNINVSLITDNSQLLTIDKSKNAKIILFGVMCILVSLLIYASVKNNN